MKFYNTKQFFKDGCTIPNLPSEYKILEGTVPEFIQISYWKYYRLFKNDKHLVSFCVREPSNYFEIKKVSKELK
jgi:hypothetical protein